MKIYKRLTSLAVASAVAISAMAQNSNSSYFMESMANRHEINPAFTPDYNYVSPLPVLGGMLIGSNSNIGVSDFLFKHNGQLVTGLNQAISADEFLSGLKNGANLDLNMKLNILSFGFKKWGGYNTFGLSVHSTTGITLPYELFEFAKVGQPGGAATVYDLHRIGVSSYNYVELALGHSRQITDRLRAGAKVKYLAGIAAARLQLDRLDLAMAQEQWSVHEQGSLFTTDIVDIAYKDNGEIDNAEFGSVGIAGNGIGFDLGASYELLDELTLSASLTDIGFISWKGQRARLNPEPFVYNGFSHIGAEDDPATGESAFDQEVDQIEDDLKALARFEQETSDSHLQSLATTLNVGAEYRILNEKIAFGLLSSTRFGMPKTWTELMASANFRPVSWFNMTVNGSVSNLGHSIGTVINFNPKGFNFYIGSDYIPMKYAKQGVPISDAKFKLTMGMVFTFGHDKKEN